MSKSVRKFYAFGPFLIDVNNHLLQKDGEVVPLTPKVFDTLLALVQHHGQVLSKDELMQQVWADAIVEENSLSKSISTLRKALGENRDEPRYIETIPKRGYRFVAPVKEREEESGSVEEWPNGEPEEASLPLIPASPSPAHHRLLWLAVFFAFLIVGSAVWFRSFHSTAGAPLSPMKIVPLTSLPGQEYHPALSPDGNRVAFTWNKDGTENFDVYVKEINSETPQPLTNTPAYEGGAAWSPDGRQIAFLRFAEHESGIYVVSAYGGTEQLLTKLSAPLPDCEICFGSLAWSPDGQFIAYPDKAAPHDGYSIFLLSPESRHKRQITLPGQRESDMDAAFSPDSQTLAFTRHTEGYVGIYLMPLAGGEPHLLTSTQRMIKHLAWSADGTSLVCSSNQGGRPSLWKVAVSEGTFEPLAAGLENAHEPTIAPHGNRLAYRQSSSDTNIWQVEPADLPGHNHHPTRLIASTRNDFDPQFSPDGQRIVFASDRSGSWEIWRCQSDGSEPVRLTSFNGPRTGTPRWSPDGQSIAFEARTEGHADIYLMTADGGPPRRLTTNECDDLAPSWSGDSQWIYFGSDRSGPWQVWKMSVHGGQAVLVTPGGGYAAFEAPDGKFLYYAKYDQPGLWQIPIEGGAETQLIHSPDQGCWGYWAVVNNGIYFVDPDHPSGPTIEFYDFATRRVREVATVEKKPLRWSPGFAVSPDGQRFLYAQTDQLSSDLMLIDNFH